MCPPERGEVKNGSLKPFNVRATLRLIWRLLGGRECECLCGRPLRSLMLKPRVCTISLRNLMGTLITGYAVPPGHSCRCGCSLCCCAAATHAQIPVSAGARLVPGFLSSHETRNPTRSAPCIVNSHLVRVVARFSGFRLPSSAVREPVIDGGGQAATALLRRRCNEETPLHHRSVLDGGTGCWCRQWSAVVRSPAPPALPWPETQHHLPGKWECILSRLDRAGVRVLGRLARERKPRGLGGEQRTSAEPLHSCSKGWGSHSTCVLALAVRGSGPGANRIPHHERRDA